MGPIYDPNAINDAPEQERKGPGIYHAEIRKCELKRGKEEPYLPRFDIQLVDIQDGQTICFDRIMLAIRPGGHPFPMTMTKAKFQALGVPLDREVDASEIVGRRCWVVVDWGKEDPKTGNCWLEPSGKKNKSKFGYFPDSNECPLNVDESQATSLFGPSDRSMSKPDNLKPGDPGFVPFWP